MIFIGGISDGTRQLFYGKRLYCRFCGYDSEISVYMTYMCFSFFFIPILKWNRKFYVRFSCCGRCRELDKEVGMQLLRGADVTIRETDLGETYFGEAYPTDGGFDEPEQRHEARYCPHCGKVINSAFDYCPYCGGKL